VVEHLPDPIAAFFEWNRVLKAGGTIFMIFPKRDALPADRGRDAEMETAPPLPPKKPRKKPAAK
jgi:ubiquinone/menaquinone biosynthesis C-methylase UbiE